MKTNKLRKRRPASPAKDPYKRRSWESDEDYNDRVQQLDAKSQQDLVREQQALDSAAEYEAEYNKMSSIQNARNRDYAIRKKQAQANRLEKEYSGIERATNLISQSKDAANIDVSTAYKNQEQKKQEDVKKKIDDINMFLKSAETASGIYGLAQSMPYLYMKYAPSLLSPIEISLVKRGLGNIANKYVTPQIDGAIALRQWRNGDFARWLETAQNINQYSGAAIDGAQIYTQPGIKDKLINGAELIPVAFDKVPNKYARLFSNLGGFVANAYDVYNNL